MSRLHRFSLPILLAFLVTGCIPTLSGKGEKRDIGNSRKGYTLKFFPKNGREYHYSYSLDTKIAFIPGGFEEDETRSLSLDIVHRPRESALGQYKWVQMQLVSPDFTTNLARAMPSASTMNNAAFSYALYENGQIGEVEGILQLEPWRFGLPARQMIQHTYFPSPPKPVKIGESWKSPVHCKYWDLDYRIELALVYDFTLTGQQAGGDHLLRIDYTATFQKKAEGRRKRMEGKGKIRGFYVYDTKLAMAAEHQADLEAKIEGDYENSRMAQKIASQARLKLTKGEVLAINVP